MSELHDAQPVNTNEMPKPNEEVKAPEQEATQQEQHPAQESPKQEPVEEPRLPEQPKEEEPKEEEKPKEGEDDLPYESTGNEYMDEVLASLHEGGVDFDKAFGKFSESGKEEDIDIAYIESVLGKAATRGLLEGVKAENQKIETAAQESAKAVHEAAGGKEMWDGVCEWIASGTSGLTKEGWSEYNEMLAQGGIQAQLAARALSDMYQQSPGFTKPANLMSGDATAQPSSVEPISRREYAEELDKVVRKSGENSPEAQLLHQRRQVAMSRGL